MMGFLGIDLGTGGVRCILIREDGTVLSEISRALKIINLSKSLGESEQEPLDWIHALEACLDDLFSTPENRCVSAISVDSTSGTILPVDRLGRPMSPALLHNDVRSVKEVAECIGIFEAECSPTFSLPKILWMQKNLPLPDDTLFLHATDFLNAWLNGSVDIPTDFTNAMKTGVDLDKMDWSDKMPSLNLPKVVSPGVVIGEVAKIHCRRWGLANSCLLVSGATDSNAAFYASGAGKAGEWSTTIGTTLAIKGLSKSRIRDNLGRIYCHRHPDGAWLPGGASNAGGEILKDRFGSRMKDIESDAKTSRVVPSILYPSTRKGERLPFTSSEFMPFKVDSTNEDLKFYLGCLEGLSFVEKMTYDLLENMGAEVGPVIYVTGGAASSLLGMQIRADMLQRSLKVSQYPNSAMGAAILAAAGFYSKKVGDLSQELVKHSITIDPNPERNQERVSRFDQFSILCEKGTQQSK